MSQPTIEDFLDELDGIADLGNRETRTLSIRIGCTAQGKTN